MKNDRLKFRVWDADLNLYITNAFDVAVKNNGELIYWNGEPIKNCTVEQCTGLKDKNSKLIFEWDIVSGLAYHKRALIAWKDGGFGFMQGADTPLRKELSNGADWYDFVSFSGHNYLNELLGSIEIIGTIHEEQSNGHD